MSNPAISICIPAYKGARFIAGALATVRAQTFSDWEIIVTEDGSRDGTEKIVREFADGVPQPVTYTRHEINRGLPASRNTGIAAARSSFIAFLDSDDLWEPGHLSDLVRAARSQDADVTFAGSQLFDDETGAFLEVRSPSAKDLENLPVSLYLGRLIIQPSSVLIHRRCFERHGGISEQFPICNDLEYWLRVASGGGKFCHTGNVTCLYRQHGSAMSMNSAALIAETARVCETFAQSPLIPPALRRSQPAQLYRNAGRMLLRSDPSRSRNNFERALRLDRSSPVTFAYWLVAGILSLYARPSK
ncbi:MAG: glycosyltransferase [Terrimicrobiaceae bacterium]|nr:glycosyltransferase [Terrimicrobiaceae bacterium]